jgi:dienelactone hydrolase
MQRRWWSLIAAVAVVGLLTAGVVFLRAPRLVIDAPLLADSRLTLRVAGVAAGASVHLGVVADDAVGQSWSSSSPATVDDTGVVHVSDGDVMDLITDMSVVGSRDRRFAWRAEGEAIGNEVTFTVLLAVDGRPAASRRIVRSLRAPEVAPVALSLAEDGVVGELWAPTDADDPGPGVVILGGSEGGLAGREVGPLLASRGIPVLGVALFDHPGLPATLRELPLEQVAAAVSALGARPEVDDDRIWVVGVSRGSEAALLTALAWPELVHGVVAVVPNAVALCSLPDCDAAAWTLGGQPVPTTRQVGTPEPSDEPAAVIEIERFGGPLVTICGGWDELWPSCRFADALASRRGHAGVDVGDLALTYPRAGHAIGTLVPYQPGSTALDHRDELARQELWPRLLEVLSSS